MTKQEKEAAIEDFLLKDFRSWLMRTEGRGIDLSKAIVWLESLDDRINAVVVGMALGSGMGCSPFCGCAANQLAESLEKYLKEKFPWVNRVHGTAKMAPARVLREWNQNS